MGDGNFRQWIEENQGDISADQHDKLGLILAALIGEGEKIIREEIVEEDEKGQALIAMTLLVKFERFPGDPKPFLGAASMPDIPEIAYAMLKGAITAFDSGVVRGPE